MGGILGGGISCEYVGVRQISSLRRFSWSFGTCMSWGKFECNGVAGIGLVVFSIGGCWLGDWVNRRLLIIEWANMINCLFGGGFLWLLLTVDYLVG